MAIILQIKNQILREKAKEVLPKDIGGGKITKLIEDMAKTLRASKDGVALAAPQIGAPLKIFIVKKEIFGASLVFINPHIIKKSKKKQTVVEGCLSVNGLYGTLQRAEKLTIEALDEKGKKFAMGVSGFKAQIIQHEVDHLDGVLFTDKAINLKKINNQNKL